MSTWTTATAYALTLGWIATLFLFQRYHKNLKYRRSLPLPPGPRRLPWIGNVLGIDAKSPWLTYSDWSKVYGDLVYSRLFGKDMIIINSEKVAKDLLENRSGNYSDRPYLVTNDLCGIGFNSIMLRYGDRWRLHRRLFHQSFRVDAVPRFQPILHQRACQLLRRLLDDPTKLGEHVFEYTASAILGSVYDYRPPPPPEKDDTFETVAKVLETVVQLVTPQVAIVVDAIPALLKLPSWLPGMSFKRKMEDAKTFSVQYLEQPFARCLQDTSGGVSMVHQALQIMEEKGTPPDKPWMNALKEAAATAFIAASDTSDSVLMTFFLLMMANPAVQEKAQAQIDAVVGRTRLPLSDDRLSLPYVDAVFREVLRFSTPVPLSVPHATLDDDTYAGFHIPKGAIVVANLWAMAHDESRYPNPHLFFPERFLNEDGSLKPDGMDHIVFGFGRRICVGRHFADASVWSVIAKFLAVYTILKPLDENGVEIPVELKFSTGVTIQPLPFRYRIVPRVPGMDAENLEELIVASND